MVSSEQRAESCGQQRVESFGQQRADSSEQRSEQCSEQRSESRAVVSCEQSCLLGESRRPALPHTCSPTQADHVLLTSAPSYHLLLAYLLQLADVEEQIVADRDERRKELTARCVSEQI